MPKTVSIAYLRANLPKLLKDVKKGQSVLISRYKEPGALISPVPKEENEKPVRRFGTGKGRVRIIDPNWADPMTDEEVEAFVEGRY
jgi:antitoxin (DNA-binding transcriptional repressor) of toxin-antitoxin stability system